MKSDQKKAFARRTRALEQLHVELKTLQGVQEALGNTLNFTLQRIEALFPPPVPSPQEFTESCRLSVDHTLKCLSEPFEQVISDVKRFEIRRNDRNYQVGHTFLLREFDQRSTGSYDYTGRWAGPYVITCLYQGVYGLPDGVCVFGFREVPNM